VYDLILLVLRMPIFIRITPSFLERRVDFYNLKSRISYQLGRRELRMQKKHMIHFMLSQMFFQGS